MLSHFYFNYMNKLLIYEFWCCYCCKCFAAICCDIDKESDHILSKAQPACWLWIPHETSWALQHPHCVVCDRFLVKLIFTGKSTAHTRPQHWSKRTPWHKEEEEGHCFTAGRSAETSDRGGSGSDIHRAWSWNSWRVHNNSHGTRYREIQADNTWNKHR